MIKKTSRNQNCGKNSEFKWCASKVPQYSFGNWTTTGSYWEPSSILILFKNIIFSLFQESLKKFREQRDKLEQSESLKQVRKKFVSTEPILHV